MESELFESIIQATILKSREDEDLLSAPYEEFKPGGLLMVEGWEGAFEQVLREAEDVDDATQPVSQQATTKGGGLWGGP